MTKGKNMKKLFLMLLVGAISVSFIVACGGGGGGGGGVTDPGTVFSLIAPGADVPGYLITGNHSGTVTLDGTSYNATGTFSQQTRDIVFLDAFGVNAMPADTLLTINTPQLVPSYMSILSTVYLNADSGNNEPVFGEDNNGLEGIPMEIHLPPAVAQVGDFGEATSWSYSNGWTGTGTWSLESSTPGFANLVTIAQIYDSLDNLISTAKITSRINEMGEPVHITYFQDLITEGVVLNFSVNINDNTGAPGVPGGDPGIPAIDGGTSGGGDIGGVPASLTLE